MYVATTQIQMGGGRVIEPGEPVADFEQWPAVARKASLDWGRVKLVPTPPSVHAAQTAASTLTVPLVVGACATNLPEALAALNSQGKKRNRRK